MIQGLLLDGIDAKSAGSAVAHQFYLVVEALPHVAKPSLSFLQTTVPRAQVAL
jgi:hypothetical protein